MVDNVVHVITGEIKDGTYYPSECTPSIQAIDFIKGLPREWLPRGAKGNPSNTEIYNWLKGGAIVINGRKPLPNDYVEYPIMELVFFPSGRRKTTIIK